MSSDKPRLWTPDFIVLLLISLLSFIGCQALSNGIPIYVRGYEGSTGFSGVLILEFSLCAGLARIAVGRVIDRGMRRRPLIVGAAFMLAGTAGALVLPGIAPQAALRALQGIGFGCVTTVSSTAAADVLPAGWGRASATLVSASRSAWPSGRRWASCSRPCSTARACFWA